MIQTLSYRFRRRIAAMLYLVFYLPGMIPFYSQAMPVAAVMPTPSYFSAKKAAGAAPAMMRPGMEGTSHTLKQLRQHGAFIGGPATPEASSFKSVGSDNLVNLFTGDFSYSIPLLDVDGYPVNLFYNGGITMEQEASWVGLGWNLNPGSVSRNMRGVPDDFNGSDTLVQMQNVKPNQTWGGSIGLDAEFLGIKKPEKPRLNFNVGFSYNNYLGPELELGTNASLSLPIIKTEVHEKAAPFGSNPGLDLNLRAGAKLSSRSGLTLSPSLNASLYMVDQKMDLGVGISTSYNSRTGIKDLNIYSQVNAYRQVASGKDYLPRNATIFSRDITSTVISFARPSYIPTLRMPMQYATSTGQVELGGGMFGTRGAGTAQGYYSESKVAETTINKPLVGYMYLEKARGRKNAVMDFNRVNDGAVTPNTPIISAPQYDYDIFSVQGEGTGGSIRAYRTDLGFMRDNETMSRDKSITIGVDIAPPGHYGANGNFVSSPTRSGGWDDGNNTLNQTLQFSGGRSFNSFEGVYFRNPGEATITNETMIGKMGGDNLVRFKLDGSSVSPRLQSQLEVFSKKTNTPMGIIPLATANSSGAQPRDKRTQIITMLTASDATRVGLDTSLRSYQNTLDGNNNLQYSRIPRVGDYRKPHHLSEITVLEGSGMRYVYGLPVYNVLQEDFTFSVTGLGDIKTNLVKYNTDEPTLSSGSISGNNGIDGYVNIQKTPAYASAFMLTGLLSPDYVDLTGDGITEDDLGTAVKFDYTLSADHHKWRTPRHPAGNVAHFNEGLRSERKDNKATISYGERESWYLHAIESKNMVAIFNTSNRQDAKGVVSDLNGSTAASEAANLKLDSISLYTKSEIKTKGLTSAVPLKTIHFDYSYTLCNDTTAGHSGGKLTLMDVYFTFNGQSRASRNMYVFNYGDLNNKTDNPHYAYNASDRWSTYKPAIDSGGLAINPGGLSNIDYPYTSQNKAADDVFAGAWALKKILLPSGGQLEVQYEADDYAYVQNRRACNMYKIYGIGNEYKCSQGSMLYTINSNQDQYYAYVQLPSPVQSTDPVKIKQEIYTKYLDDLGQLAFKLNVNMPKGSEPLTVYSSYDDYGLCPNSGDRTVIYFKLRPIDNKSPLANASVHFLLDNLPAQVFPTYDLSGQSGITAFLSMIGGALSSLSSAFTNAESQVRNAGKGSSIALASSFVRLAAPTFFKYGGGHRVKRMLIKDNWNAMSGQYDSQYGQDYDYTTTTKVNGMETTISSGVASYEPGIGSEENPFREILQFENKLPLASAQYGAIEMPMLEGLYPSPVVGYSKVTVRSIHRNGTHGDSVVRSAIGKQVTEFYTAKDYPSYSTYTSMNNMDYHNSPPFTFFYKEVIDRRTTSQGFLVETNDMHGKLKSQAAYSESDEKTPLSYTVHSYKNTGANGLNDKVDFIHREQGGAVISGNMGVDMELMTDVREFNAISSGTNIQAQVDFFTFVPWPVFGVFVYPLESYSENKYRAVTTTKLINYHAIEDSVIAIDKGSTITSKTVAYDAETGSSIVRQTLNEFNNPVYTTTYPAFWAYSGMGPAYSNIGAEFTGVDIIDGKIISGIPDQSILESGDELYIESKGGSQPTCPEPSPDNRYKVWVFDITKNTTSLTVPAANRNLMVLDSSGGVFTKTGVTLKIVRSGHRNLLNEQLATVTSLTNPIVAVSGGRKLAIGSSSQAVAAAAIEYREKWQTDNGVITKRKSIIDANCNNIEIIDCGGYLEKRINPYTRGLLGNFKNYRSLVFYGDRAESDPTTFIPQATSGVLNNFKLYWDFDVNSNLVPDGTNSNWVWNSQITKVNARGMEIENKNALNIFTAAQYGYHKTLPVAVTQNSRAIESSYEGFEDISYQGNIDGEAQVLCPGDKHVDYSSMAKTQLVNTDTTTFTAHTGSYVLGINKLDSAVKGFTVRSSSPEDFSFSFGKDTSLVLSNMGINVDSKHKTPVAAPLNPLPVFQSGVGFTMSILPSGDTAVHTGSVITRFYNYNVSTSAYVLIPEDATYNAYYYAFDDETYFDQPVHPNLNIVIQTMDGVQIPENFVSFGPGDAEYHSTFCLPKGVYKITIFSSGSGTATPSCGIGCPGVVLPADNFHFDLSRNGTILTMYKTATLQDGCIFTLPAPATDSMLNGTFTLPVNKQMVFSTWVREDSVAYNTTSYTNNQVRFKFNDVSATDLVFKPAGPIIEGWQRYEAKFTIPATATTMTMSIRNFSGKKIYFDDIRIHPFNGNMKSYVYDPRTLRLSAELDENNYATFYNYDEEGQLIRVKQETMQGIKTIKETRSSKQRSINTVQ